MTRLLYEQDVKRRLLALREDLIRHDENAKALALLEDCVPFFLSDDPDVTSARERTRKQSGHLRDPNQYAAYYASNRHERPFEQQTGLTVETADRIPRCAFLRAALGELAERLGRDAETLDLAGNDGWVAAHMGHARVPVVFDPARLLEAMRRCVRDDGRLFVSTPDQLDHWGDLPDWDADEPKGHLRVFDERSFRAELERVGEVVHLITGPDRVMVAEVKPT